MGWCHDDAASHEGYLVAVVSDDDGWFLGPVPGRMRELASRAHLYGAGKTAAHALIAREILHIRYVKAACSCGWRSPLLHAPDGTSWMPSIVCAPPWFEDAARALWLAHANACGPVPTGGLVLRP